MRHFVSRRAPNRKLCQLPLPHQRVLVLIAGINYGRPVLDVSLTPFPPELTPCNARLGCINLVCLFWTSFLGLHLHLGPGQPPRLCHIRLQGIVATIGAQAILLKKSRPQAIIKSHHPVSLDYRAATDS